MLHTRKEIRRKNKDRFAERNSFSRFSLETPYGRRVPYDGVKMNSVWEQVNKNNLISSLNGILTMKITNYNMTNILREELVEKTKVLIKEIKSYEN